MSPMLVDQPKCDKLCDFKMAACNRKFKKYVAYFCHANADTKWVMKWINTLESEKYGIKCGEYDRNFSCGGKYITDLFQEFLENSHHVVVVLSPEFVQSKWSMYQLNLAVQYSINNNGSIVPLMIKSVAVPDCLKCFEMVDATKKQWFVQLLERLCSPAVRVPKLKPFCTREDHISIDDLKGPAIREIASISCCFRRSITLSQNNFDKVKAIKYMSEAPKFLDKVRRESFAAVQRTLLRKSVKKSH